MILQRKDLAHCLACIKCSLNASHHHYVTVIPSRNFWKDSFMRCYFKTHDSPPFLLTSPFVSLSVIQELLVFIFYRGWDHIPCRQPGSEPTGQEVTDPSDHSSPLFPPLSPTTKLPTTASSSVFRSYSTVPIQFSPSLLPLSNQPIYAEASIIPPNETQLRND